MTGAVAPRRRRDDIVTSFLAGGGADQARRGERSAAAGDGKRLDGMSVVLRGWSALTLARMS
jgi:hypothetical protein